MNTKNLIIILPLLLAACGETRIERAGSGAVIGTAVGAGVGLICCGDPIDGAGAGAVIGAITGGAIGAIVDEPLFFDHHEE